MHKFFAYFFPVWLMGYSVYSFSQTDPNLVLSSNFEFWNFQQTMWRLGLEYRQWSVIFFVCLILGLFLSYFSLVDQIRNKNITPKRAVIIFVVSLASVIPSYPALSHDVFNYLFNAKMVLVYRANPHVNTALDFPADPWIKFMHNVHTPAPYGYGWTGLSLVPYWLGRGHLQTELLIFRMFAILSLVGCLWLITKIKQVKPEQLALLAFNPLVLIEIVGNIHNDLVMMALALAGGLLIFKGYRQKKLLVLVAGIGLFGMSVSIKYASIALVGAAIAAYFWKRISFNKWAVLSLWSPLLTTRSQRFLPWYLTWSLVFLPLIEDRHWQRLMIAASFASITSYWFILYCGDYSPSLLLWRSGWLFGIPLTYWLVSLFWKRKNEPKY